MALTDVPGPGPGAPGPADPVTAWPTAVALAGSVVRLWCSVGQGGAPVQVAWPEAAPCWHARVAFLAGGEPIADVVVAAGGAAHARWARHLLALPAGAAVAVEDAGDALGEVANVVAGVVRPAWTDGALGLPVLDAGPAPLRPVAGRDLVAATALGWPDASEAGSVLAVAVVRR